MNDKSKSHKSKKKKTMNEVHSRILAFSIVLCSIPFLLMHQDSTIEQRRHEIQLQNLEWMGNPPNGTPCPVCGSADITKFKQHETCGYVRWAASAKKKGRPMKFKVIGTGLPVPREEFIQNILKYIKSQGHTVHIADGIWGDFEVFIHG